MHQVMEYHEHSYLVSLLFAAPFLLLIIFSKFFSTCLFMAILFPSIQRPPQRIPTSIDFSWRRCKDIPQDIELYDLPVVLNGTVYVKGRSERAETVCTYTPGQDVWTALPPPAVYNFTIATLKDQLVLVGGTDKSTREVSDKIIVWDRQSQKWVYQYPPMTTARANPAAVGYDEDYLIVAGGSNSKGNNILEYKRIPDVNILDTTSRKWVTAESLPSTDYYSSVLIEDTLYLVGYNTRVVLRAHVPTLISQATSATRTSSQSVWESLPNTPFYRSSPIAVDNVLVTVGGSTSDDLSDLNPTTSIQLYNTTNKKWTRVGDLPEGIYNCYCTVLSGELLVLGGRKGLSLIRTVYAGKLTVQ